MARKMSENDNSKFPVRNIPLSQISTDSFENSRSGKWDAPTGDENAVTDFVSFRANIRAKGQEVAVVLRNTPKNATHKDGSKVKEPYELIVGYRRHGAIAANWAEDVKTDPTIKGEPTIKAELRGDMTNYEARQLNGFENVGRENLSAPDQAWLLQAAWTEAKAVNLDPTDTELGTSLGFSQSWAQRLLSITRNVKPSIFTAWRKSSQPLTVNEMLKVVGEKTPAAQQEMYNKLVRLEEEGSGKTKGPGAWVDGAIKQGEKVGGLLGLLEQLELIQLDEIKFNPDFVEILVESKFIKIGKKGDGIKARTRIAAGIKRGYESATEEKPAKKSKEESEEEAA